MKVGEMPPQKKIVIFKSETQQSKFLSKYPEYDGRGIKIAIIDIGFDPTLPGLQKTTTGLPKIIDCFEDPDNVEKVDTSLIKEIGKENERILTGISGRKIKIPSKWKNPSDEWHLGFFDLRKLCKDIGKKDEDVIEENELPKKKPESQTPNDEKPKKADDAEQKFDIDCIVWDDEKQWNACLIQQSAADDLENATIITNFGEKVQNTVRLRRVYMKVLISKDGKELQICVSKDHGTQVAHVAAAHFPDSPEFDGLAPGAQVLLIKLNHLRSWNEAFLKCIEYKVDIVNISMLMELDKEAIKTITEMFSVHGIIVVRGAGNSGPCYSTLKETWEYDRVLSIGGLLTPEITKKFENFKRPINALSIADFSSKGPSSFHHSRGITFVAPAAAIVPQGA